MQKKFIILFLVSIFLVEVVYSQPTAFINCPNDNVAVVRSGGSGATTNPFSIYSINPATGTAALLNGPILDPADTTINLQINGIGLNELDGYLYGQFSDAPTALTLTPTTPYYRLGSNAAALQLGTLGGPALPAGDNGSFVFPNAGEFNQSGSYFFVATTGFVAINIFNIPASTFTPSAFYIGTLTGSNSMTGGTGALSPTYVTITNPSNDAAGYLSASSATITATSAQGLGLQDLVYNNNDGNLYTYVHYADTASSGFYGQMLKINPTTGVLSAQSAPAIQSFITSSVYPNGTLIDANGDFLIMMTNGDIYKADGTFANFPGTLSLLNTAPGLPGSLTGDLAACGMITIALPHDFFEFDIEKEKDFVTVSWSHPNDNNVVRYTVQYSEGGQGFIDVGSVEADGSPGYFFEHENYFVKANHYYRIKLTDKNGKETYSFIRLIKSSISEVRFFPNPVLDILHINLTPSYIGEDVKMEIYNNVGQMVVSKLFADAKYAEHIDISSLAKGSYFVKITSAQSSRVLQVTKE